MVWATEMKNVWKVFLLSYKTALWLLADITFYMGVSMKVEVVISCSHFDDVICSIEIIMYIYGWCMYGDCFGVVGVGVVS